MEAKKQIKGQATKQASSSKTDATSNLEAQVLASIGKLTPRQFAKLSSSMGPTVEEIMAEEFDEASIVEINKAAALKVEHAKAYLREEATEMSIAMGVLRQLREQAGISQKEMAERLVVSAPAISKMEAGDPQMSSVVLYANAIGVRLTLAIDGLKGMAAASIDFGTLEHKTSATPAARRVRVKVT